MLRAAIAYLFYGIGHSAFLICEWTNWEWSAELYQSAMAKSSAVQGESERGPWQMLPLDDFLQQQELKEILGEDYEKEKE